nr:MAG TPA: putative replisome organizer protein [Bacteriophage sp.]
MSIANKAGWPDTFTVASSVLGLRSGLNASALKRARNKLATDGFIEWKARGGNLSAQYKIKSLVVQNCYKNEPQNEPQCEPQNEPINKQRHKQKHNTPPISPVEQFEEFAAAYPKRCTGYLVETEYCNAVLAGVPEDDLVLAAQNYADTCRREKTAERYIKKPENWLRENLFMQYLKGEDHGSTGRNTGTHEKSLNELMQERGDTGEFQGF